MRLHVPLAALALALASLTACGSDADSAYCKELKSDKAYFESFSSNNPNFSKIDEAFDRMHSLADKAPDEVADDWKVLDEAFTSITKALKDAGISFADIGKMQQGQMPKGANPKKLAALAPKLQKLTNAKFDKASKAIEKHAKATCKVSITG
jgi:hypothetical protein